MDRGFDPFLLAHYEELRLGNIKREKPRLLGQPCVYDKYWVCFDMKCTWCKHNPFSQTIKEYHEGTRH